MGNYVIAVGNYLIVSPSELGNYKIADKLSAKWPNRCDPYRLCRDRIYLISGWST